MVGKEFKDTYYRGLIYTAVTDTGPKVLCNLSQLDEDHTFPLSVQAFTLLGLGSGSRKAGTWMEYAYGPLPFPTGRPLNTMVFSFLVEGSDSKDDRVKKSGRSAALIFIVTKQFTQYDKLRNYINNFMPKWIEYHSDLKTKHLKQLNNQIQGKAFFRTNLDTQTPKEQKKEDSEVKIENESMKTSKPEIKSLKTKDKNLFMEKLVELDNLSNSLLILYETSQNPTITELTKISGTSRIMTTFSLRKYIKNGIISVDGDNITFL